MHNKRTSDSVISSDVSAPLNVIHKQPLLCNLFEKLINNFFVLLTALLSAHTKVDPHISVFSHWTGNIVGTTIDNCRSHGACRWRSASQPRSMTSASRSRPPRSSRVHVNTTLLITRWPTDWSMLIGWWGRAPAHDWPVMRYTPHTGAITSRRATLSGFHFSLDHERG